MSFRKQERACAQLLRIAEADGGGGGGGGTVSRSTRSAGSGLLQSREFSRENSGARPFV